MYIKYSYFQEKVARPLVVTKVMQRLRQDEMMQIMTYAPALARVNKSMYKIFSEINWSGNKKVPVTFLIGKFNQNYDITDETGQKALGYILLWALPVRAVLPRVSSQYSRHVEEILRRLLEATNGNLYIDDSMYTQLYCYRRLKVILNALEACGERSHVVLPETTTKEMSLDAVCRQLRSTSCTFVDIGYFQTSVGDFAHISHALRLCTNLLYINFSNLSLSDEDVPSLEALCFCNTGLEYMSLSSNRFMSGDLGKAIARCRRLKHLNISYNPFEFSAEVPLARAISLLSDLVHLDLRMGKLSFQHMGLCLRACSRLEYLDVGYNPIGPRGAQALRNSLLTFFHLEFLGLNLLSSSIVSAMVWCCPTIKRLSLAQMYEDGNYNTLLDSLNKLTLLRCLDMHNIKWGACYGVLGLLNLWTNLTDLDISGCILTGRGDDLDRALRDCRRLVRLTMSNISLKPCESVFVLNSVALCASLEHLLLDNVYTGQALFYRNGQAVAAILERCTRLRVLSINGLSFGPVGGKLVAQSLRRALNMVELSMQDALLTRQVVNIFVDSLRHMLDLKKLDISQAMLSKKSIRVLARALPHAKKLEVLTVNGIRCNDIDAIIVAKYMPRCKALKKVVLLSNDFRVYGAGALASAAAKTQELHVLNMGHCVRNVEEYCYLRTLSLPAEDMGVQVIFTLGDASSAHLPLARVA